MTTKDYRSPDHRWKFAALLAALSTLGPFSIDAYLPAFAGIQQSLEASPLEIQQTMSGYLFAFGIMFLFHGALSDSFGRRPVILVALVVYTLASVGAAIATTVHGLVVCRVVQGLSVGAGMVVGRAMIRDLFNAVEAQRLMSLVTLFFGLAPAIAPIIGGWLFIGLGWRSIFWFLAAVGFILVAVSWRALPETLAEEARQSFHPVALWHGYREVGIDRRFLLLSLTAGFNFNAFFLYIVSAPVYLGEHLRLGPQQYAWLFIPSIAGIMIGARISGLSAGKVAPWEMVKRAYIFMATAAIGNLAYAFLVTPAIPWAMMPIFVFAIGFAMAMPSITLITLDLFPTRRGMAASLQGFVSGMVNTVNAGLISPALSGSTWLLAVGMLAMTLAAFACWSAYRRLPPISAVPDSKFLS